MNLKFTFLCYIYIYLFITFKDFSLLKENFLLKMNLEFI